MMNSRQEQDHHETLWKLMHDSEGNAYAAEDIAHITVRLSNHLNGCMRCNRGYEFGPAGMWIPGREIVDHLGRPTISLAEGKDRVEGFVIPGRPGRFPLSSHQMSEN